MVKLSNLLAIVGLCALLAVTALTLFDIALRSDLTYMVRDHWPAFDKFVMNSGVEGISDLYAPLGVVAVAFCFPSMVATRGAITVRFITDSLPWRLREALGLLGDLCLLAMFALMAWFISRYTIELWNTGETTWLIGLPQWPAWTIATVALWMAAIIQAGIVIQQIGRAAAKVEPEPLEQTAKGAE